MEADFSGSMDKAYLKSTRVHADASGYLVPRKLRGDPGSLVGKATARRVDARRGSGGVLSVRGALDSRVVDRFRCLQSRLERHMDPHGCDGPPLRRSEDMPPKKSSNLIQRRPSSPRPAPFPHQPSEDSTMTSDPHQRHGLAAEQGASKPHRFIRGGMCVRRRSRGRVVRSISACRRFRGKAHVAAQV